MKANMKILVLFVIMVLLCDCKKVSKVTINDKNFLKALIELGVDSDEDGIISSPEAAVIKYLNLYKKSISDLTGIEAFFNLDTLVCSYNQLTSLDVSNNTFLKLLNCATNQITTLDISKSITLLTCEENQITTLDVSNNTALYFLQCSDNKLTTLNISKNPALEWLNVNSNKLINLEVSNNSVLHYLDCSGNQLTILNISNNLSLQTLSCGTNQLSALDVSNQHDLRRLFCGHNLLTSLDISNNSKLGVGWENYYNLDLDSMPGLQKVCVWTMPFPPAGLKVNVEGSLNVYFTTQCNK
jgi:hypothetical protein